MKKSWHTLCCITPFNTNIDKNRRNNLKSTKIMKNYHINIQLIYFLIEIILWFVPKVI